MEISDIKNRFFSKIAFQHKTGCTIWVGARRPTGYGLLSVDNKLRCATHVSWFLKHGVWPVRKLLHTCDNPPCVDPGHLFEGTAQDNADDRDAKGRGAKKLTGLEVSEIIALTNTRMSLDKIASLFGITANYVSQLRHGRRRKGLTKRGDKPMSCTTVQIDGVEVTLKQAAAATGLAYDTLNRRVARGLTGDSLIAPPHMAPRKPYERRL